MTFYCDEQARPVNIKCQHCACDEMKEGVCSMCGQPYNFAPTAEALGLADRLASYIPDGDGYNDEYANTLTAAVAFLRGASHE